MSASATVKEIDLGTGFGEVVFRVNGTTLEVHADGSVDYTNGSIHVHAGANDGAAKNAPQIGDAHEIGAVEPTGAHKGEIYGGLWSEERGGDNKPIWFSAARKWFSGAPKLMEHYAAAAWAKEQGGSLPTRKQGDYLTTLKGKGGAFTEIFNRGVSFPAGYVWLAEPFTASRASAWCQRLSDGYQDLSNQYDELPVLSVRR